MDVVKQPQEVVPTEFCPVALGVHFLGDRWSLLVVREMMFGARHFNEIHRGVSTMSRTLLATRLRHLERIGVVRRQPVPQSRRHEYLLTEAGEALRPVLEALGTWTTQWQLNRSDAGDGVLLLSNLLRSVDREAVPHGKVTIEFHFADTAPSRGWLHVDPARPRASVGADECEIDLMVKASPQVLNDLWHERRSCDAAIDEGAIELVGPGKLVKSFRTWFVPASVRRSSPG